jgi:hypothetical protein
MQPQADSMYLFAKIMLKEGQKDRAIETLKQIVALKTGLLIFRSDAEKLLAELQAGASDSK